jgi:hypothetical protein
MVSAAHGICYIALCKRVDNKRFLIDFKVWIKSHKTEVTSVIYHVGFFFFLFLLSCIFWLFLHLLEVFQIFVIDYNPLSL